VKLFLSRNADYCKAIFAISILLCLAGCRVNLSQEGSRLIAVAEADKPHCIFITEVQSGNGGFGQWTFEESFELAFNAAMNDVAAAGADSYEIIELTGSYIYSGLNFQTKAWSCNWSNRDQGHPNQISEQLNEITPSDRSNCDFIRSSAKAANWSFRNPRTHEEAQQDALKFVRLVGGDSYYIAWEFKSENGLAQIIEAWQCS
jgi:hypothetical protein